MTGFDRSDLQRFAVSAVGALLISATCIIATVTPAKAGEITVPTASAWKTEVEKRIDRAMATPRAIGHNVVVSEIVIRFDDRGGFRSASLRKPSGLAAVDSEALRIANTIRYPALPVHLQGKPQSVGMQIVFGANRAEVAEQQRKIEAVAVARMNEADKTQSFAKIAGQPTG